MSTAFVGNLTKEAAAAALASVWMNIGNTTLNGFMTAVDTLLNQSYGAKKYAIYGMWTANTLLFVVCLTCDCALFQIHVPMWAFYASVSSG